VFALILFSISFTSTPQPAGGVNSQPNREISASVLITNAPPKDYTGETFAKALRQRLTPEEASLLVNPLSSTPEMKAWARKLTAGETNDLQRARKLYDALAARVSKKPAQFAQPPTAQEVFAAWNTPEASFTCQDLAFLYVALARAAGLRAYCVFVDEDSGGNSPFCNGWVTACYG
jgi:transglutaminase-like putative cysteine protease